MKQSQRLDNETKVRVDCITIQTVQNKHFTFCWHTI